MSATGSPVFRPSTTRGAPVTSIADDNPASAGGPASIAGDGTRSWNWSGSPKVVSAKSGSALMSVVSPTTSPVPSPVLLLDSVAGSKSVYRITTLTSAPEPLPAAVRETDVA